MTTVNEAFEFKQCVSLLKATGRKAGDLRELREILSSVSDESLFHHTYQYFLKGHILEYTNDFAQWAGENLEERALSEELSNIDPYDYSEMTALRERLISVIEAYIGRFPEPRAVMEGAEFYFTETVTLVFPAGIRAKNLAELLMGVKYVDSSAIYYHFYEARRRLGPRRDDFSHWIEVALGKEALAEAIRGIDPFMHTLAGIRNRITEAMEEELRKDMEEVLP
ncbi:MAG: DUF5752 family protein [Thermodesulfovibrionales bacterium]|jgi:hypothetical protein